MNIHIYQVKQKVEDQVGLTLYITLMTKIFLGLSLTRNLKEVRAIHMVRKVGESRRCFCWGKGIVFLSALLTNGNPMKIQENVTNWQNCFMSLFLAKRSCQLMPVEWYFSVLAGQKRQLHVFDRPQSLLDFRKVLSYIGSGKSWTMKKHQLTNQRLNNS